MPNSFQKFNRGINRPAIGSPLDRGNVLTKGLVAYWPLWEGAGEFASDISGSNNKGTLTNGPVWNKGGTFGNTLKFDGVSTFVSVKDTNIPSGSASKTVSAWINTTTNANYGVIFKYGTNSGNQMFWFGTNNTGGIIVTQNGASVSTAGVTVTDGKRHMVTVVFSSDINTYTIYVDGTNYGSGTMTTATVLTGTAFIGKSDDSASRNYAGFIDSVMVYNRPLSAAEVRMLYTSPLDVFTGPNNRRYFSWDVPPLAQNARGPIKPVRPVVNRSHQQARGLIAAWPIFEGAGDKVNDVSGFSNHGTRFSPYAPWVGTAIGKALDVSSADIVATVVNQSINQPTASITISSWVFPNDWSQGNGRIIQKGDADNQYRLLCEGGVLKFDLNGVTGTPITATLPATGKWHHIVGTYNGSAMALYVDSILVASGAASGNINTTQDLLDIGNKHNSATSGDKFKGLIGELRIYSRGVTADEVRWMYRDPWDLYKPSRSQRAYLLLNGIAPASTVTTDMWYMPILNPQPEAYGIIGY